MNMYAGAPGGQKRELDSLKLELQGICEVSDLGSGT